MDEEGAASEAERVPVVDPGVSIDPEDMGRQFLRDATEQDNFESEDQSGPERSGGVPVGEVISEATRAIAGQLQADVPESSALRPEAGGEKPEEPALEGVDLLSNAIREGSLFDRFTEQGDTRAPRVSADEEEQRTDDVDAAARARASAVARALERLRQLTRAPRSRRRRTR